MASSFLAILLVDELGNVVSEIPFDLCSSRAPTYSGVVTKFPVEGGSSINDHRRVEPDVYEIEGTVSASPLGEAKGTQQQLRGDSMMAAPPAAPAPTQAAYDALLDLHQNSRLCTIVDQYRQFSNMALTRLSFPLTNKTGCALDFSATFEQIKVVRTSIAALPPSIVKKLKKRQKVSESDKKQKLRIQAAKAVRAGKVQPQEAKPSLAATANAKAGAVPRP